MIGATLASPITIGHTSPRITAGGYSVSRGRSQPLGKRKVVKLGFAHLGGKKGLAATQRLRLYASKLAKAGIGQRSMNQAIKHVELGAPSSANDNNPVDILLARNEYIVSYNAQTNTPNWVAFHVDRNDLGDAERPDRFRRDPTLPEAWQGASDKDYKGSGYTRGHLADAGTRSATPRKIRKTFVMTNVVPQSYENNAGPWNDLEMHLRDQVRNKGQEVSIFTGPIYDQSLPERVGSHQVAVPSALWKIAVIRPRGTSMNDLTEATRVISVIVPNTKGDVSVADTFEKFRVSPRDIEARTGLTFLTNLTPELRAKLITKVDDVTVTEHFAKSYKMSDLRKHYGGPIPSYWIARD